MKSNKNVLKEVILEQKVKLAKIFFCLAHSDDCNFPKLDFCVFFGYSMINMCDICVFFLAK